MDSLQKYGSFQSSAQRRRSSGKGTADSDDKKDAVLVEYNLSDTFSSLLEKCLIALNIKGSNSTTASNDDDGKASSSVSEQGVNVTRQALLYDQNHVLINMVREVKEGDLYQLEVIDNELMQINNLETP